MGAKITKIGITNDKISGRGGLPLFLRYVQKAGFYGLITGTLLSLILKSIKGLQLQQFIKQMLAFFIDGTDMAISGFDKIKNDQGYAAILECKTTQLASSHQIKLFLRSCLWLQTSFSTKYYMDEKPDFFAKNSQQTGLILTKNTSLLVTNPCFFD